MAAQDSQLSVGPEDRARADLYRLVAHFLSAPPSAQDLTSGQRMLGDATPLGQSIDRFAAACGTVTAAQLADEYQDLFIGLGRGELVPYGSYYLTGFLHEKPLSRLREDMARLGLERGQDHCEPEDHIASELEMMAGFIDGAFDTPLPLAEQKEFFAKHLGPWAGHFFKDLEGCKSSRFYASLGTIGRLFMSIEQSAFDME